MIEPKIRIESDGTCTRLWINDVEIHDLTMLDFHAEPDWASCEYYQYKRTEGGKYMTHGGDVLSEKHKVNFKLKETT